MQAYKFFNLVLFISITDFKFYGCMFAIKKLCWFISKVLVLSAVDAKKNPCAFSQFEKFVSADLNEN